MAISVSPASWVFSLLGVEVQERQDAACLFVDNDLGSDARHELPAGSRYRCAVGLPPEPCVFRQQGIEPGDIAFRFIDPLEAVSVCLADTLVFLAFRQRDHFVVVAPGLVDELLLLLLGLVDLIERLLALAGAD